MKSMKQTAAILFVLLTAVSCHRDEDILYNLDYVQAPSGVTAAFDITQDNTGLVTIIPNAEGATKYKITFGDTENETPAEYGLNDLITHYYPEGIFQIKITASGITGLETDFIQEINVSFKPPENLVIQVENDPSVSKQVNISATADNTTVMDFFFGEVSDEEPVKAMPGETVSHIYESSGDYDIRVVARGAAIATIDTIFTFTVTEILEPLEAAPVPPAKAESDVITIFSDAYSQVEGTDFNPNWGQSTISSVVEISGNNTLKYANLNYQGTQFGTTVDASSMEYLHIDMWTLDATQVSVFPISIASGEKSVDLPVVAGEWQSYDIPMSDFTGQGLAVNDLHQFKFVGTDGSTIFLDNLYFYKESDTQVTPVLPLDFESSSVAYAFTDFDGGGRDNR